MRALTVVAVLTLAALAARLYLAAAFFGNFDQESYEIVARIVRSGGNVYAETPRYNYSPLWSFVLAGMDAVAQALRVEMHTVVRTTLTLVDLVLAALIAAVAARAGGAPATAFARYFANPVAILIVGYHGQFEDLAAVPLLAAMLVASGPAIVVWALTTASLLVKHIVLFSAWTVLFYRFAPTPRSLGGAMRALAPFVAAGLAGLVVATTFVPYWSDASERIVGNVIKYRGLPDRYGVSAFLPQEVAFALFVPLMAMLPVVARDVLRYDLLRAVRLSSIALLVLIPGIGEQYFLIPVIFGAAGGGAMFWAYSAAATLFLLASPNNVHLIDIAPPWQVVWIVSVMWLGTELIAAARRRR